MGSILKMTACRVLGSTAAVRKEILRVMGNKEVWESKVAWRKKRLGQLSPAFQAQVVSTP